MKMIKTEVQRSRTKVIRHLMNQRAMEKWMNSKTAMKSESNHRQTGIIPIVPDTKNTTCTVPVLDNLRVRYRDILA